MSFANLISTDYESLTLVVICFFTVSGVVKIVMEGFRIIDRMHERASRRGPDALEMGSLRSGGNGGEA